MAVIIKGMKMPKYCNDCQFVIDSFGECTLEHEKIENYDFFVDENKRPKWCPLKPAELCEDCISRAEAINAISHAEVSFQVESNLNFENYKREVQEIADGILKGQVKAISDLSSIQPKTDVLDKIRADRDRLQENIKALGEDMRKCQGSITDEKVLIGFNMAVALCNKHLAGKE